MVLVDVAIVEHILASILVISPTGTLVCNNYLKKHLLINNIVNNSSMSYLCHSEHGRLSLKQVTCMTLKKSAPSVLATSVFKF